MGHVPARSRVPVRGLLNHIHQDTLLQVSEYLELHQKSSVSSAASRDRRLGVEDSFIENTILFLVRENIKKFAEIEVFYQIVNFCVLD